MTMFFPHTIRTVGAVFSAICGLLLCFFTGQILLLPSHIDPSLTDSMADKIFFVFMVGGGGVLYILISIKLFVKTLSSSLWSFGFLFFGYVFAVGLYYHIIFGSPW